MTPVLLISNSVPISLIIDGHCFFAFLTPASALIVTDPTVSGTKWHDV